MAVQDAESYQQMVDRLRELEDLSAIQAGIAQADTGEVRPALEALQALREKHGL